MHNKVQHKHSGSCGGTTTLTADEEERIVVLQSTLSIYLHIIVPTTPTTHSEVCTTTNTDVHRELYILMYWQVTSRPMWNVSVRRRRAIGQPAANPPTHPPETSAETPAQAPSLPLVPSAKPSYDYAWLDHHHLHRSHEDQYFKHQSCCSWMENSLTTFISLSPLPLPLTAKSARQQTLACRHKIRW